VTSDLRDRFGDIDIYVFDQLLRGRIREGMRVLDAGCGGGRNLVYLLGSGLDVWGVDTSPSAIQATKGLAARLAAGESPPVGSAGPPSERFRVAPVEAMPFADAAFDVVLSSAVLHFARDEVHWEAMVDDMWRVLAPGGLLFARLASTIGIEERVRPLGGRRFLLPDGSERFLVDEARLMDATARLGARQLDPLKTTVVQAMRSMTTWVIEKPR
jgi:SAM-dependent methyltransferase